jgi:hypothetical protein
MIYVDFNEMIERNIVLLSREDVKIDRNGNEVFLEEGLKVTVYMDDLDDNGNVDDLIANGTVVKNTGNNWARHVKWCCLIDSDGIRLQSEIS